MTELIAGVDKAGRGSLLGRVYAGCVIWDDTIDHTWLKEVCCLHHLQCYCK